MTLPAPIRLLPEHLCRLIAAGEVVSRPLDVVRELIDNALDAGATRLEIALERGGLEMVEVRDNGQGMPSDMLELAVQRHATSKLQWRPDALEHVQTLGFRGEALWAIAQAGELRLQSRPAAQLGASEVIAFGDEVQLRRLSAAAGTQVQVRQLFAHLPARLHTQLAPAAEVREIVALVGRYVLHYPALHWRLLSDGEPKLSHSPSHTRGAVASVYGSLSANRVLELHDQRECWQLSGVLSRPELSRVRRDRMHFAINGRPIVAPPELEKAVIQGYGTLLPLGHAPLCIINITLPPQLHNPNVHPSKQTVAVAQLDELCQYLTEAVAALLSTHSLAPAAPVPHMLSQSLVPEDAEASQGVEAQAGQFPSLELLGVYQALYLLAQGEGDLWLIDGHAAHERIWYERLEREWAGAVYDLPEPELLPLTPLQQARLHERAEQLAAWGVGLEEFGKGLARLRSLPLVLAQLPIPALYEQLRDGLLDDMGDPLRLMLGRLACAPALKAGMLTPENGRELLAQLSACRQPWACPHGRPTTLRLSERDLAHAFGRRGVRDVARGRDEQRTAP